MQSPSAKKLRLLVTGANGLLGSNLVLSYKSHFEIYGTSLHAPPAQFQGHEFFPLDLTEFELVNQLLAFIKPHFVIHTAALTDVDFCEQNPKMANLVNQKVTAHIAQQCKNLRSKLVFISSDAVYDSGLPTRRNSETAEVKAQNYYTETKLWAEREIQDILSDSLIIRTCLYGWNLQNKMSFSEFILDAILRNKRIQLFEDVFFSPTLVNDLADALKQLMELNSSGIFNIGASDFLSKYHFGLKLAEIFKLSSQSIESTSIIKKNLSARRPMNPSTDITKLCQSLNRQMPTVHEGLVRFRNALGNGYLENLSQRRYLEFKNGLKL